MRRSALIVLVSVVMFSAMGCSIVRPSDAVVIDLHAANAAAINAKVQADPALPPYAKTWWAEEERTWRAMSEWAHGRRPEPRPVPGE
jgi:hypothetical protein